MVCKLYHNKAAFKKLDIDIERDLTRFFSMHTFFKYKNGVQHGIYIFFHASTNRSIQSFLICA